MNTYPYFLIFLVSFYISVRNKSSRPTPPPFHRYSAAFLRLATRSQRINLFRDEIGRRTPRHPRERDHRDCRDFREIVEITDACPIEDTSSTRADAGRQRTVPLAPMHETLAEPTPTHAHASCMQQQHKHLIPADDWAPMVPVMRETKTSYDAPRRVPKDHQQASRGNAARRLAMSSIVGNDAER